MNPTIAELFRRLEDSGIRYVILRNWEGLFEASSEYGNKATDVDLVIASEDIPRWREIAVSLARDFAWDALTECPHFTRSRERAHHIEIFRFYRHSDGAFLQVDLFHAYLVWGVPFLSEAEMLEGRAYDSKHALTRIDPLKENAFRLLQINGLIPWQHSAEKIERYRRRVLAFAAEHEVEFEQFLERCFPGSCARLLDALRRQDFVQFRRVVRRAKWDFVRRNSGRALGLISARVLEARKRYFSDPCGCVLRVHTENAEARSRLIGVFDELKRLNFIDLWVATRSAFLVRRVAIDAREQGGLVVRWSRRDGAQVVVCGDETTGEIRRKLVDVLVRRHRALYSVASL